MRKSTLNVANTHVVLILVQIIIILYNISFQFFLNHFLIQKKLDVLFLDYSPLELHGSVATHALDHDTVGFRIE